MKALLCTIIAVLLLSAAPAPVAKKNTAHRTSVTLYAEFIHGTATVGICAFPIWMPQAYVWGVGTYPISCPGSSVVVDVVEGQTVSFATAVYLKTNITASPAHVVTAADIAAGAIYLFAPI